jgi:hypothetical protein
MRAKPDAGVERPIEVQVDGWAELVRWFAFQTDKKREKVAMLLDADALGDDADQAVRVGAARAAAAPTRYSMSVTRTSFSGRCARWIMPRPCSAAMASLESSSRS